MQKDFLFHHEMGGCNYDDSMINVWGNYGISKTSAAYINKRYVTMLLIIMCTS